MESAVKIQTYEKILKVAEESLLGSYKFVGNDLELDSPYFMVNVEGSYFDVDSQTQHSINYYFDHDADGDIMPMIEIDGNATYLALAEENIEDDGGFFAEEFPEDNFVDRATVIRDLQKLQHLGVQYYEAVMAVASKQAFADLNS